MQDRCHLIIHNCELANSRKNQILQNLIWDFRAKNQSIVFYGKVTSVPTTVALRTQTCPCSKRYCPLSVNQNQKNEASKARVQI